MAREKALGVHLLELGSAEAAEEFYAKLGYTGQLLIQSQKHTIDELLSLNPGYPIVFTNIYDSTVNQVCLKLPQADRALQKLYETTFDDCYTQTMFWKIIWGGFSYDRQNWKLRTSCSNLGLGWL